MQFAAKTSAVRGISARAPSLSLTIPGLGLKCRLLADQQFFANLAIAEALGDQLLEIILAHAKESLLMALSGFGEIPYHIRWRSKTALMVATAESS